MAVCLVPKREEEGKSLCMDVLWARVWQGGGHELSVEFRFLVLSLLLEVLKYNRSVDGRIG